MSSRIKPYTTNQESWYTILQKNLRIPMNQRDYSWGSNEITKFLDDIFKIYEEHKYVEKMGSIINLNYNNGNDIYVKCNPILPEDVELDENNDIHIYRNFKISDIWGKEDITVNLGDRDYTIKVNKLKLIREQTIILINSGISYINLKKIYDVSIMTTVFIHISLEM